MKTAMRRFFPILALLFVLAATPGCVSPERLFNLTPMGDGDPKDTVNLWPLYYSNGEAISVLWPVFDADADGFALRPLLFRDGHEWGLLWPVCDFDRHYFRLLTLVVHKHSLDDVLTGGIIPLFWIHPKGPKTDHHFYQFLLAYKSDDGWGIFPLLNHDQDHSYCFPLYYYDRDDQSLLTPVSYTSKGLNYITLAWWDRDDKTWGVFPFCRFGDDWSYCLNWWRNSESTGLFPLYAKTKALTLVGPVWWHPKAWGVFPFCRFGDDWSYCLNWWHTPSSTGIFPFYIHSDSFHAVGPVWWDKGILGLFPLFHWSENDKFILLYSSKHNPSKDQTYTMLLPIFNSERTKTSHSVGILFHLLGGYRVATVPPPQWNAPPPSLDAPQARREVSFDWLCFLGKSTRGPYGENGVRRYLRTFPFFSYERGAPGTSQRQRQPAEFIRHDALCGALWNYNHSVNYRWKSSGPERKCTRLASQLDRCRRALDAAMVQGKTQSAEQLSRHLRELNELCQELELEPLPQLTRESLDTLEQDLLRKYPMTRREKRSFGMLLDLVDYERDDEKTDFRLLWGALFRSKQEHDRSETSFLWRGYRKVATPKYTSLHVFPFISRYENHEQHTTVSSFGWRLFRRETSPQGSKLWLFFIPFQ